MILIDDFLLYAEWVVLDLFNGTGFKILYLSTSQQMMLQDMFDCYPFANATRYATDEFSCFEQVYAVN